MSDIYHAGKRVAGGVNVDDTQATDTNVWSAAKTSDEISDAAETLDTKIDATAEVLDDKIDTSVEDMKVVVITTSDFSALPQTITNEKIKSNHVVINSVLSNPAAQISDWTVNTATGSLVISGSISGSTTLTLYLGLA